MATLKADADTEDAGVQGDVHLSDTPKGPERSFKRRIVSGSVWTFFGFGTQAVLRLGANIILARLLFPEAFGVMAIVNVFLQGLQMFSDLGIVASIIQNPRGEQPEFLRTAWVIGILRGALLSCVALAIAWPVSQFYNEPRLLVFLPVAALTASISGFISPSLFLFNRRLEMGKLISIDIACQVIGTGTMIVWSLVAPSIWALVGGGLVTAMSRMVLSHIVAPRPRMRFEFHRDMAGEVFHFGKWIFFSSILGFLVGRVDRLVLGKFLTLADLGVYAIAATFSVVAVEAVQAVSMKVVFPVYSHYAREVPERLRRQTVIVRTGLMTVTLPPCWFLIVFGPELVDFLYDERYLNAGWMLQILASGAVVSAVFIPIDVVLLAVGDSYRFLLMLISRSFWLLVAMVVGGILGGPTGLIIGFAVSPVLYYPFLVALVRRYNVWIPLLDFGALFVSAVAIGVGFWLKGLLVPILN